MKRNLSERTTVILIWYAAGFFISLALAWVAAMLQAAVRAPFGSISIGLGIALAVALSTLAMLAKMPAGRTCVAGAIVLAAIAVLAQHTWLYLDYRRQWQAALADAPEFSQLAPTIPSPLEYFAHELTPARGALWCIDAALVISTAAGAMYVLERKRREFGVAADAKFPDP